MTRRIKKANLELTISDSAHQHFEVSPDKLQVMPTVPKGWTPGALLNVRATGDGYTLTLWPEEYDYRHPERAMFFPNQWLCQDFISQWYAKTLHDPRAR